MPLSEDTNIVSTMDAEKDGAVAPVPGSFDSVNAATYIAKAKIDGAEEQQKEAQEAAVTEPATAMDVDESAGLEDEGSSEGKRKRSTHEEAFGDSTEKENQGEQNDGSPPKVARSDADGVSPSRSGRMPKKKEFFDDKQEDNYQSPKPAAKKNSGGGKKALSAEETAAQMRVGFQHFVESAFREAYMGKHPKASESEMTGMAEKVWSKMKDDVREGFVLQATRGDGSKPKKLKSKSPYEVYLVQYRKEYRQREAVKKAGYDEKEMRQEAKITWDLLAAEEKTAVIARISTGSTISDPKEGEAEEGGSDEPPAAAPQPAKKPAPKQTRSAFEYFMLDFKQSEAAKEGLTEAMEKGEKSKVVRALGRAKWDTLGATEKAPFEATSKEARQAAIIERDESLKPKPVEIKPKPTKAAKPRGPVKRTPYECFILAYRDEYRSRETPAGQASEPYDEKKMRAAAKEKWEATPEEEKASFNQQSAATIAAVEKFKAENGEVVKMAAVPQVEPRKLTTTKGDWQQRKKTSAYDVYHHHYQSINKHTKGIIKAWSAVSEEERKPYAEKAVQLPVPPPTAMCGFLEDYRTDCADIFPGASNEDVVYSAMECWEDVMPAVKAPYLEKSKAAQVAYEEQMGAAATALGATLV